MTGSTGYYAGLAAEDIVARHYEGQGMAIAHHRWRGDAGEVDLIARNGDQVVFVEVKKSRSFAAASYRLGPRQMDRILAAGSEFISAEPAGLLTDVRFDLALVNNVGDVQVVENAFCEP